MTLALCAFTDKGMRLACALGRKLGGVATRCGSPGGAGTETLAAWTARAFAEADGLVFVGAAGIAVRAVAPHVASKAHDPAIVVVDECATWAVSLLSGHLGGANALACAVAGACGAQAVVTTATDVNGVFAVDDWARAQGCAVANPAAIKRVASTLLAGGVVRCASGWPIAGPVPPGVEPVGLDEVASCDVVVDVRPCDEAGDAGAVGFAGPSGATGAPASSLRIVPRIAVVGVGCRRGTPTAVLEARYRALLQAAGVDGRAVAKVCTIDVKRDEPGIAALCAAHGLELQSFSAEELEKVAGAFGDSAFVRRTVGVGNVCERAAVAGCGAGGALVQGKMAVDGVTMALAFKAFAPDWGYRG